MRTVETNFPKCRQCNDGDLVPFSDFGTQSAPVHYKAWVCTNPDCGFNLKIRSGDVMINEPVIDARQQRHVPMARSWAATGR
ncbi:MAG: hypothetical protein HY675_19915 [Chloroflexi bacterium]|nr:hypothetical protein [Chloroflexota bacterium]